jgi:hypothetical protein
MAKVAAISCPSYPAVMHVNVEKTTDRPTIIAVRDDGVSLRVRAPDRKFSPPHDLIHFVYPDSLKIRETSCHEAILGFVLGT